MIAYELGPTSIKVQFADRSIYLYTYSNPGRAEVEVMKQLAAKGKGLTTYINQKVRGDYAAKLKPRHPMLSGPGTKRKSAKPTLLLS